jgi:hypothetical protein
VRVFTLYDKVLSAVFIRFLRQKCLKKRMNAALSYVYYEKIFSMGKDAKVSAM